MLEHLEKVKNKKIKRKDRLSELKDLKVKGMQLLKSKGISNKNKSGLGGICAMRGEHHCQKDLRCCKPDGAEITEDVDKNKILAGLCIKPPEEHKKKCQYLETNIAGKNKGEERYSWNLKDFLSELNKTEESSTEKAIENSEEETTAQKYTEEEKELYQYYYDVLRHLKKVSETDKINKYKTRISDLNKLKDRGQKLLKSKGIGKNKNKSSLGGICGEHGNKHCEDGLICCKPDGSEIIKAGRKLPGLCIKPPEDFKDKCQYEQTNIAGKNKGEERYSWNLQEANIPTKDDFPPQTDN